MDKWTFSNLPPEGHPDVGRWFWDNCFVESEQEKDRLNLKDRWHQNHKTWRMGSTKKNLAKKNAVTANLIFSNIQRTVANLTSKNPSAEVVSLDGAILKDESGEPMIDPQTGEPIADDGDKKVTVRMKDWWNTTEQIGILVDSVLNMETYGITVEKGVLNSDTNEAMIVTVDPYSYIIAPGNWLTPNDAPYCGQISAMRPDAVDTMFGLKPNTTTVDETYSVLGEDREDNRPRVIRSGSGETMYGNKTMHRTSKAQGSNLDAMVVELFVRDNIMVTDEDGKEWKKYPGGIRLVTLTNGGEVICADMPNPNVNPEIPREQQANTYLYDHFPYSTAVSYRDTTSSWGFAAAEQVGDLAEKISELLSRMYRYLARVMLPPLVLPLDTGLTLTDVNNNPGLVLQPNSGVTGQHIRYVTVPNLPSDTIKLFDMLLGLFDRIYQIEDADRGDTPDRVIAASAIVALQEKNAVLMRHKIRMADYLIRQRGRIAISFFQNFGVTTDSIKVDDEVTGIRGIDLIDRNFQYVVESGSTIAQTSLQVQEQALDFHERGIIDNQAVLDVSNFPDAKRIIERMAESGDMLDQAGQAFVDAGIPVDYIQELIATAKQPQTTGATA